MNYYSADASLNYDSLESGTWCAKVEHIDKSCTVLVWIDGIESKLPCKSLEHANSVIRALQGTSVFKVYE